MSFRDLKIGDGKKYDLSEVSSEGISKEERAALEKKNNKLIDIFKAFDLDGDGGLNKLELAMAMDAFSALDADGGKDGKLSKKELEKGAEYFNEAFKELGVNVEGKDLKAFIKSVFKATKGDKKESTESIIHEYDTQLAQQEALAKLEKEQAEAKAKAEAEAKAKAEAEAKAKAEAEAQAAAEKQRLATPTNYTVQPGEKLEDLLKRSLEAQGKEVNEENLAEAKAEFIKNNPNALHGKKGKEYLYMGDVVKIAGALEDKGNADEIKADYRADLAEKREAEEAKRRKAEYNFDAHYRNADGTEGRHVKLKPTGEKAENGRFYAVDESGKKYLVAQDGTILDAAKVASKDAKAEAEAERKRKLLEGRQHIAERSSTYVAPRISPDSQKVERKTVPPKISAPKADPKKLAAMEKYPLCEKLPNGYSRRDAPGFNDAYFDAQGNRISKEQYMKARGVKSRAIDNMVKSPILEQLSNGYTKRDTPGPTNYCYDAQGNRITEEEFQKAKKALSK